MKRLTGNIALITGAGRGIGRGIALRFAEEGCSLVLGDLDLEGVQETAELAKQLGVNAFATSVDVTNRESVITMIANGVTCNWNTNHHCQQCRYFLITQYFMK